MAQPSTGRIEVFQYPATPEVASLPDWQGWMETTEPCLAEEQPHAPVQTVKETEARAEFEKRLAEETRKSFEAGRERGRQEGRQQEHDAQAASVKAAEQMRVRQGAELIESFAQERDRYLHKVEQEVVKLALAVAARILRREAQMDPLLLTGAVRVAMGQLSGSTEVKLRVPAADLALWTDAIALLPNLALKPTVSAGEGMRLGDCVIETSMGSVDLGIRSQLGEIERGFFDRTAAASGPAARTELIENASNGTHA
ncbi:MAG: FliH/SctL family protein [Terracidiphilus sp.]|nr:FliH/SctL family protein [Terracidiphilus sp.]